MKMLSNDVLLAAMKHTVDTIQPRDAQLVNVFVSGYKFENENSVEIYRAMLDCDEWERKQIASDVVVAYCDVHGILWGTIQIIHVDHFPQPKTCEGHFVVEAVVTPRVEEE